MLLFYQCNNAVGKKFKASLYHQVKIYHLWYLTAIELKKSDSTSRQTPKPTLYLVNRKRISQSASKKNKTKMKSICHIGEPVQRYIY